MLKYTGHPLVDVGAATLAAFEATRRMTPEQLTSEQLDRSTAYIESHYGVEPFSGYIRVLLPNSGYVNAGPEKRKAYIDLMLHGYKSNPKPIGRPCSFCGDEATSLAFRQNIPLLSGEQAFNFFAEGQKGLPVCHKCLLSIQAFPLGSVKCNGKALIVHSANPDLTYEYARRFSIRNREFAGLGEDVRFPKTMLIEILLEIYREQTTTESSNGALTAYHLTNFGTNADIDIYHLPLSSIDFIRIAKTGKYKDSWNSIVDRAWEVEKTEGAVKKPRRTSSKDKPTKPPKKKVSHRNFFYEDLFDLPDNAGRFLRVYFLRLPLSRGFKGSDSQVNSNTTEGEEKTKKSKTKINPDPRYGYSFKSDAGIVSWNLTSLFLRKVMNMDKVRIDSIRQLADRLVDYVQHQDARLFSKLFSIRRYGDLSLELLKADKQFVQAGQAPLFTFRQFVDIFEESEDMPRADWSLARDLVLVRMIEQLHQAGWWSEHNKELEEATREVSELDQI